MYTVLAGTTTGYTTKYSYDKVGRLTTVDTPGTSDGKYKYTYDSRGNRVKEERTIGSEAPTVESDTYNAQNQVTSDSWTYDADGNLIKDEKAASTFNAANQKVETKLNDGSNTTTNSFAGTSQNELIGQNSSKDGTFVYTHGLTDRYGNPQIEKITHAGRSAYVEHDPVTHEPLFLRDTDKTSVHMYISDPVDSDIRMVKDDAGTADYKEFDPFGARDEKISPRDKEKFDPYRYRFGLLDRGGTGQYLFGARFYDPTQGVWTQQDFLDSPLDPVNANRYAYAGADPINNYDPLGQLAGQVGIDLCFFYCGNLQFNFDDQEHVSVDVGAGGGLAIGVMGNVGMNDGLASTEDTTFMRGECGGAYGGGLSGSHSEYGDGSESTGGDFQVGFGAGCAIYEGSTFNLK